MKSPRKCATAGSNERRLASPSPLTLTLTLTRRANPKHSDSKESIGLWPPGEWPLHLPSIEHLTSAETHKRTSRDLKMCVAQSRGLGGFILQPLAERAKP